MVNKQVQFRRSSESSLLLAVPADGEPGVNSTKKRLHIGDGATSGGIPHANFDDVQGDFFIYGADTGSANAYALDLPYDPLSYRAGLHVKIKILNANTGASTLTIAGIAGTKNIYKYTAGTLGSLAANDFVAGGIYDLIYDGTQWQLQTYTNAGLLVVKQGDLSTSTGTVSASGGVVTLPGGEYGFSPQIRTSNSSHRAMMHYATGTTSYVSQVQLGSIGSTGTFSMPSSSPYSLIISGGSGSAQAAFAQQRYINSSPPFDLGEGEAGGFFFAEVNPAGEIVSTYMADVPPWGYNGPTSIRADKICPIKGTKFRTVMVERTIEEIMDGAKILYRDEEITMEMKNRDMGLIPHPFEGNNPANTIVLIDPMDERIRSLIEYQNAGGADEILKAISSGQITADVDKVSRRGAKCPKGVAMHKLKFKYSKGK